MKQYIRYLQVLYRYNSQGKKHNKKKKKCTKVSRKQFGANGVGLRVKRRLDVLYVQHLVD